MTRTASRGQTLVEFALAFPLFVVVLMGIILFGLTVFYQQQLTNAAREAARYASITSVTSQCPTASHLSPVASKLPAGVFNFTCDAPPTWSGMTAAARSKVFGINPASVQVSACWSGYVDSTGAYDAPAVDPATDMPNQFLSCTMRDAGGTAIDPRTQSDRLPCPPAPTVGSAYSPPQTDGDDKASNLAVSTGDNANQVTVYTCFVWQPPLGGVGVPTPCPSGWCTIQIIPATIPIRAVITEALQHQQ